VSVERGRKEAYHFEMWAEMSCSMSVEWYTLSEGLTGLSVLGLKMWPLVATGLSVRRAPKPHAGTPPTDRAWRPLAA